uniref:LAM_G_DOMAIN domain-containing protein n=1 Tax=Rhabditophanes sp. KR3021 TaxID=114890 RepID=A0AC35TY37_9BILA
MWEFFDYTGDLMIFELEDEVPISNHASLSFLHKMNYDGLLLDTGRNRYAIFGTLSASSVCQNKHENMEELGGIGKNDYLSVDCYKGEIEDFLLAAED